MVDKSNSIFAECLSQDKDILFENVSGLTWFPWVGKKYFNAERRILLVGESHYCIGENIEAEIIGTINEKWYTRDIVRIDPINQEHYNAMFENLHRCLFQTTNFDRKNTWEHFAFYNFIQRPMNYNIKERPRENDMLVGWKVFTDVVKILQPIDCVFVGIQAANYFNSCMSKLNVSYRPVELLHVEGTKHYARRFSLQLKDLSLSCIAIQHTSHHFSWKAWHNFLSTENYETLKFLNEDLPHNKV